MSTVTESIDVNVPVRTAYDQWTQFESFPKFMDNVQQVQQLDATHLHWRASIDGKDAEWDAVITEEIPDERIAWKSTTGTPNSGVVTFHRLGPDETKVTLQMNWQPEGVTEHIGDVLGFDSRSIKGDLDNFKQFIESRGAPTGAWRGEVNQSHTS
jgi:uncharacterized membrane protein